VPSEDWVFVLDGENETVSLNLTRYAPAGKKAEARITGAAKRTKGDWRAFAFETVGRRGDKIGDFCDTFHEPLIRALGIAARSRDTDDAIADHLFALVSERGPSRTERYDQDWLLGELRRFRDKDEEESERPKREAHPDVARVNRKYAVLALNGSTTIAVVTRKKFAPVTMESFGLDLRGEFVLVPRIDENGEEKIERVPLAEFWLDNRGKRKYDSAVFDPSPKAARYTDDYPGGVYDPDTGETAYPDLNLWRGPAVVAQAGKCDLTRAYILDVICSGDTELNEWVLAWLADIYQRPHVKSGASLCIRGGEGTGKTKFGAINARLLGPHYFMAGTKRQFVGNFNSALADKILIHVDEAFYAGDHETAAAIKNLVTADDIPIEFKGKEIFVVKSFARYLFTGNPDQLIKAGMAARRFAAISINEEKAEDHAYFKAIDDELDNGGAEAFLDYLLKLDISQVNLRKVPRTAELLKQKIYSMEPFESWLMNLLMGGVLPWAGLEPDESVASQLFKSFIAAAGRKGHRIKSSEIEFGIKMTDFFGKGGAGLKRNRLTYQTRTMVPTATGELNPVYTKLRSYVYRFPPLAQCRALFDQKLGQKADWPPDVTEWGDPAPADDKTDDIPF
jgi:hypothetical protein